VDLLRALYSEKQEKSAVTSAGQKDAAKKQESIAPRPPTTARKTGTVKKICTDCSRLDHDCTGFSGVVIGEPTACHFFISDTPLKRNGVKQYSEMNPLNKEERIKLRDQIRALKREIQKDPRR
jgi:hypothetical protein